ncbi:disease resistance protein RFL1-like [Punica granatum]|uniref:Disease resistance protein RFL1-like n=1 Tax=Punica granatum TaxID=22663 RepID=A0A6P8DB73_PUNGR|nr:disease resistance protein RFL1-like [Punica granatum]
MARTLSDVSDIESWQYALDGLRTKHASCGDEFENVLTNVLKFSTELLENDVTRVCLRSFALRGVKSEAAGASLIDSWIREGILVTRSEGERVIKNLLDEKLLELSKNGEFPEEACEFMMRGGLGLVEPSEVGEWERAKEICLMQNDFTELPENPRRPSLSVLFLQRNHKLRTIPPSFSGQMPALEVLNQSRTSIKSLPDSLFQLVSLKRLFLNECILLRTLSAKVGGLKNLEVLDPEGTKLMGLPKEIEQLVNLTCLEVSILGSASHKLSKTVYPLILSGVLSSPLHLEELNIDVGPDAEWWDSRAEGLVGEICSLERLSTLLLSESGTFAAVRCNNLITLQADCGKHIGRLMSRLSADIEFELEQWDRYLKYIQGEGVPEEVKKVSGQSDAFFSDWHASPEKLSCFGTENMEQLKCCVLGIALSFKY